LGPKWGGRKREKRDLLNHSSLEEEKKGRKAIHSEYLPAHPAFEARKKKRRSSKPLLPLAAVGERGKARKISFNPVTGKNRGT